MKTLLLVAGILTIMLSYDSNSSDKFNQVITGYDFNGNGWQPKLDCFDENFKQDSLASVAIRSSVDLAKAINNQLNSLIKSRRIDKSLTLSKQSRIEILKKVQKEINDINEHNPKELVMLSERRFHRLSGEDGCGNVLLTGYYTPTIKLKRKPDSTYRFPLYKKPVQWRGDKPLSRNQIDNDNGLHGLGLEIGYSSSLLDIYFVHVQGSTYAHFVDTNEYATLAFSGKNGKKYESLGKYLVGKGYIDEKSIGLATIRKFFTENPSKLSSMLAINPSYVFFTEVNTPPITSSGVPALTSVTAAVDPDYIPYGSILLVESPLLNNAGEVVNRQYKLVIASDSGSAIKGKGHIDLYLGKNPEVAGKLHHYGRVWLVTE